LTLRKNQPSRFKHVTSIICYLCFMQYAWRCAFFMWYSRFRDGRELVWDDERGGHPKSTRTEVNIAAVADLFKSDRRIASRMIAKSLNIGFWERKEKAVCTFCSTPLDTWEKGKSSHIVPRHYRDGRCRQNFFELNYYGWWDLVFCLWLRNEATDFWVGWWDFPSAEETEILKVRHQEHVNIFFFRILRRSAQRIRTRGKKAVNAEFYEGAMDRLLKRIQRDRPAWFCSRDFFLLHDNAPAHKAPSFCQFLTPK